MHIIIVHYIETGLKATHRQPQRPRYVAFINNTVGRLKNGEIALLCYDCK